MELHVVQRAEILCEENQRKPQNKEMSYLGWMRNTRSFIKRSYIIFYFSANIYEIFIQKNDASYINLSSQGQEEFL
jgi:hypothetical protein